MFQFEASRPSNKPLHVSTPEDSPYLSHRAFLAWGEHCVECAMPACYETCDLFDSTPSAKCRRFVDGIVPSKGSAGLPGGEIRFRKWAKLETQGNATMVPNETLDAYEGILTGISKPLAFAGRFLRKLGAAKRWLWAEEALHKRIIRHYQRRHNKLLPNVFLAEITNPTTVSVPLILTAYIDKRRMSKAVRSDQLPAPATIRLVAAPGFTRTQLGVDSMYPIFESGLPFNLSIVPENDQQAHLIFHRLELGKMREGEGSEAPELAGSVSTKAAKLVIFDLDNTLWKGVLLEGDVLPLENLSEIFRTLDERGILLSVASKNSHDDAISKLRELGLEEFLLYPQIGWNRKSESVDRIVKAINIGSDTVIFIDDNAFERAEVATSIAGVEVLPETSLKGLLDHPRLQGAITAESRARRQMYKDAIARTKAADEYGDDYLSFLRSCEIVTWIRPDKEEDFERIAELVQRTNQLNFSGRKYAREETRAILQDIDQERFVIECSDKFGNYGVVGFGIVSRSTDCAMHEVVTVEDFMLSCRVQGKFIEQAFLWYLARDRATEVADIRVIFRQTDRNKAAQMVLEKMGFKLDVNEGFYFRKYSEEDFLVNFMEVKG